MPVCKECKDEVDELFAMKVDGRKVKLCEDCVDRAREEAEIAGEALGAMQNMIRNWGHALGSQAEIGATL